MAKGRSQFTGAAGQFFVAYGLTVREIHASQTIGNAPSIDIMAANSIGSKMLSIQVKTARWAGRRAYGHDGFNWDVGANAIGKYTEAFWYAFVDLKEGKSGFNPDVYFIPSRWVGTFVEAGFSRAIFFLEQKVADKIRNNWHFVQQYLDGNPAIVAWANSLDEDFAWWGTKGEYTTAELEEIIKAGRRWDPKRSEVIKEPLVK